MASTYQVTGFPQQSLARGSLLPVSPRVTALATSGWGLRPSALHAGSVSFGNENSHPNPGPERGNAARGPCVCARARLRRRRPKEEKEAGQRAGRLSASARCPRYTQTHSSHVFTKLSVHFVPGSGVLILAAGRGGWGGLRGGAGLGMVAG